MHDHERDIIDQIDEVTEPGPDALRWAPSQDDETPNTFDAMLLGMNSGGLVPFTPANAEDKVRELVGDPFFTQIEAVNGVVFWVPTNGAKTSELNVASTHILINLVRDVADGDYATSDDGRRHARVWLDTLPALCGPCLITGVNSAADGPGPLPDAFWSWFERYASKMAEEMTAQSITALLRNHGIPPETVGHIVIVED